MIAPDALRWESDGSRQIFVAVGFDVNVAGY